MRDPRAIEILKDRRDYRRALIWKRNGCEIKIEAARKKLLDPQSRDARRLGSGIALLVSRRDLLDTAITSVETVIREMGKAA